MIYYWTDARQLGIYLLIILMLNSLMSRKGGKGGSEEEVGVTVENGHGLSELEMFEVEILTNLLKKLTVGLQTWMLNAWK